MATPDPSADLPRRLDIAPDNTGAIFEELAVQDLILREALTAEDLRMVALWLVGRSGIESAEQAAHSRELAAALQRLARVPVKAAEHLKHEDI